MSTRDQILDKTCELLEVQGYHATGLNQIVAESGSPKGSLYYYFPDGKEGLMAEAIERTGQVVEARLRDRLAAIADPGEAVEAFLRFIAQHVEASGFQAGGPITTVAMETAATSERLSRACSAVFRRWQRVFEEKLVDGGHPPERATALATLIMASFEGAILLSRTHHDTAPLEQVAVELRRLLAVEPTG